MLEALQAEPRLPPSSTVLRFYVPFVRHVRETCVAMLVDGALLHVGCLAVAA